MLAYEGTLHTGLLPRAAEPPGLAVARIHANASHLARACCCYCRDALQKAPSQSAEEAERACKEALRAGVSSASSRDREPSWLTD